MKVWYQNIDHVDYIFEQEDGDDTYTSRPMTIAESEQWKKERIEAEEEALKDEFFAEAKKLGIKLTTTKKSTWQEVQEELGRLKDASNGKN